MYIFGRQGGTSSSVEVRDSFIGTVLLCGTVKWFIWSDLDVHGRVDRGGLDVQGKGACNKVLMISRADQCCMTSGFSRRKQVQSLATAGVFCFLSQVISTILRFFAPLALT